MDFEFLEFLGGLALGAVGIYVKDAVSKTGFQNRLAVIEDKQKANEESDKEQGLQIQNNREMILKLQQEHVNLDKKFEVFLREHRQEMKEHRTMLSENSKTLVKLDTTLEGLKQLFERLEDKMNLK